MLKQLTVAAGLIFLSLQASAADLPAYPFIHANGRAFIHVVPDRGEIDVDISAYDADPAAARAVLDARAIELHALLAANGQPEDKIKIHDVRKEMRKATEADPKAEPLYDFVCTVHMEVNDLSKWAPIMSAVLDMKNLTNFSTTFSVSNRDQIEEDLSVDAIKDARRRAEAMARGLGKQLGAATAVSSGPLKNLSSAIGLQNSNSYTSAGKAASDSGRDLLMIVTQNFQQDVDAIFKIK